MVTGLAEETSAEIGRRQFETGFWGAMSLTNALLPSVRARKEGQIVTVSSTVGLTGPPSLFLLHRLEARRPGRTSSPWALVGAVQHQGQHGGAGVVQDQARQNFGAGRRRCRKLREFLIRDH
ncbi:hypothetical protein [Lysobacter capsici]|uniref:hypothetical protein n=1 Tax=Lysobacter capsici TaxID=435897 RepID=UPI003CCD7025